MVRMTKQLTVARPALPFSFEGVRSAAEALGHGQSEIGVGFSSTTNLHDPDLIDDGRPVGRGRQSISPLRPGAATLSRAGVVEPKHVVGPVAYGAAASLGAIALCDEFIYVFDDLLVSVILTLIVALWLLVVSSAAPGNRR